MVSTCCLDGALRLWDARTGSMVSEYRGHTAEILDFTINRYHFDTVIALSQSSMFRQSLRNVDFLLDVILFQGSIRRCHRFRRQPGESLLPTETRSVKRAKRRGNISGGTAETFHDQTFYFSNTGECFPFSSGFLKHCVPAPSCMSGVSPLDSVEQAVSSKCALVQESERVNRVSQSDTLQSFSFDIPF